ncbi:MAG: hypothetical protein K9M98_02170 [Cephaloticoccus sp.]|nr:hypothetical protein [Cephaloticoccus sp.]MCF7759286.1 hypothetical protein [Cephaloticoccus sp.]
MNPTHIVFPAARPELRLKRSPATDPAKLRELETALMEGQKVLQADNEALRQREENLQAYEQRLRSLQNQVQGNKPDAHISTTSTNRQSAGNESALTADWSKLHRARELLEVEQRQLSEDQHVLLQARDVLRQREANLIAREEAVALAEARLQVAAPEPTKPARGLFGLTRAPFKLPKSVFTKS